MAENAFAIYTPTSWKGNKCKEKSITPEKKVTSKTLIVFGDADVSAERGRDNVGQSAVGRGAFPEDALRQRLFYVLRFENSKMQDETRYGVSNL